MNGMEVEKVISITDVHAAAFLELNGIPAELTNLNGSVIFTFPSTDKATNLLEQFARDCSVPIQSFIRHLRIMRARMYQAKGGPR